MGESYMATTTTATAKNRKLKLQNVCTVVKESDKRAKSCKAQTHRTSQRMWIQKKKIPSVQYSVDRLFSFGDQMRLDGI